MTSALRSSKTRSSKTVLITGATAGIGAALVRRLHADGHSVIATGRRAKRLAQLANDLPGLRTFELDVNDTAALGPKLEAAGAFEADVLVNNAGLALGMGKAHDADLADFDTMIDTNVRGLVHVTRHLLPHMVKRNCGHIVMLGSVAGSYPYPGGNVYGATKAFVEQFALGLRADLHGSRVRVTNIEPGMVETEFSDVRFKGDAAKAEAAYEKLEALTSEDIADVIAYCIDAPERVNINRIELMSIAQSFAGFAFDRK
jgi:3-hydroxy acid dehydrogenase / malonic semialdehyde reductase